MKTLEHIPFTSKKAIFKKLEEIADVSALSPEERDKYENSLRVYNDHLAVMDYAEQEGMKKGFEKGKQEGKQEGKEEGKQEGKEEEQLRIAQEMKSVGMDTALISQITKLSIADIEKL